MVPANNDKIWSLLGENTAEVPLQEAIAAAVTLTVTWALRETVIALMVVLDMGHVTLMASAFDDMQTAAITPRSAARNRQYPVKPSHHRPLICALKVALPKPKLAEKCGPVRIRWWRLKEKEAAAVSRILLPAVTTVSETR
uniref:Uncharacterized protein n=1 Tax=Haemonchus contortus TaxID=6289 RepID=A0A7I4YM41_HAECO